MNNYNQPKLSSKLKKLSLLFSIIVVSVGFIVLIGWAGNISFFKSISPDWISMKPNAAICFLLAGLTLVIINREKQNRAAKTLSIVFPLVIILIGTATLLQYIFHINFGIDEILFRDDNIGKGMLYPGRLPPAATTCFIFFGFTLLAQGAKKNNSSIYQSINLLIGILAFITLICYLFGVERIFDIKGYQFFAFHGSVSFLLLILAAFFMQSEKGFMKLVTSNTSGGRLFRILFPLFLVIPIFLGWLHLEGEKASLFNRELGDVIFVTLITVFFAIIIFIKASRLSRAEKKLKQSEAHLQSIFANSSVGLILLDTNCTILELNNRTRYFTSLSFGRELMKGENLLLSVPGYSKEELRKNFEKALQGKGINYESAYSQTDGSVIIFNVSLNPVIGADGVVVGACMTFENISERKKAEQKIKGSEEQHRDLVDNISDLICIHDLEGNILSMNLAAEKMTGFKFNPQQPMNIKDLLLSNAKDDFNNYMTGIKKNGFGYGLMKIKTKSGEIRIWEYNNSLKTTGLGTAIVRGYARDITEQKEAEKEMMKSEEKFRTFFDQSADAIFIFDGTGHFLDVNIVSVNLLGYTKSEFKNMFLSDLSFKEDLAAIPIRLDLLAAGESVIHQRRFKRKDGSATEVEVHSKKMPDGNYLGVVRDITERKKTEEKLKQLSQAVEQSPASVVITDLNGNIQYVNQKFFKVTGYTPEEVMGKTPRILKSGYTSDIEYENLWKRIASGQEWQGELHNKKKNGEFYWESALISPIFNEKGVIINFLAIKEDITERKKVEAKLLRSHKQFQTLVESISGTYWVTDLDNNQTIYVSPSFEVISGRKSEELYKDQSIFMNAIHPEDKKQLTEIYKNIPSTNKLSYTYRIIKPDGEIRWISAKSSVLIDSNGHKMEYGYAEDMTDRKQAEEALKESEETFRRLFDESADPVLLLDERGFVDCNQSAVSILGFAFKHEVTNKKPWEISPEKQPDGMLSVNKAKAMIAKALELGYNRFEWMHAKSDKTEFPVEVMLTPILLGGKQSFYTVWRDITERKKAEKEKQKAFERYDILARATSDTIWDWDMVNNKMLYNDGINKMFGYEASEVKNVVDWWNEKLHPDDFQKVTESLNDIFEKGSEQFQLTYRFRSVDGSYKHIFDRAFVIFDENNKPSRMIGAMQDITHQIEEEMRISKAIIDAQEGERRYIGAELHDNVNQILAGSLLSLGMVKVSGTDTEKAPGFIEMTRGYIGDAINEIRKLSHQLVPATLKENSLKDIFESLLCNINLDKRLAISLHFDEFNETDIPDDVQINLYRILQEQVKNILKYSEAGAIEVVVKLSCNTIILRIFDNGKGFDTKTKKNGIGLSNIKKRAESLSGKFILNSAPGKGCEIIVEIPVMPLLVKRA